jgi:DNA-binding MarR family transcriptional regulator
MKENDDEYAAIRLKNQLCFPIYAYSKEIVRRYKPYLDEIDLTYTQYIAMMVMWEHKQMNVKSLGEHLYLDSGTLTPLLKKLEEKGYIKRTRSKDDERNLNVEITKLGMDLRDKALMVPKEMGKCVALSKEEFETLYKILYKMLGNVNEE